MPEKTARGGINACEPPFLRELEKNFADVREEIYSFDNEQAVSLLQRIRQVVKTAHKFRKVIGAGDFDLFHINTAFILNALLRDVFTVFWIGKRRTKLVLKFHGSDAALLKTRNLVFRFLIRYLLKRVDGIGVLSSEERRNFVEAGLDERKFHVVKNVVNIVSDEKLERVFSNSKDRPIRLLFVSRLIPAKGLLETIEALEIVRHEGLSVVLNVLGDGEARAAAIALADTLSVTRLINFHGHVSEEQVIEYYRNSDVLVFPTYHHEGFPMVIFNALAFGLPIVTTRIRAAADYLHEGENCLFCEERNSGSVAGRITELANNVDLCRRMSVRNQILARAFSASKIAPEYAEIYRQICR